MLDHRLTRAHALRDLSAHPLDALIQRIEMTELLRKLALRYDRQAASVLAFLHLAYALICLRYLAHPGGEAH